MKQNARGKMKLLWSIFCVFFKIGPSTFGGGYAMIATIEEEIVRKKRWMNEAEMGDMISVSGSAPGGVAVNSATFIGYRLGGVAGAVAAVIAITLPTFLIVFLLSGLRLLFKDNVKVEAALKGIHAAVVALIIVAAGKMWKASVLDAVTFALVAVSLALLLFTQIHPFYLIVGGLTAGVLVVQYNQKRGKSIVTEQVRTEESRDLQFPEYYI
ncbi:chromate transporter [Paenibacillus tritici]|uniref:Chromate transporter n=1 Tax=Paenibacillus tritici TaxID=1873425 RepID=A0ABX2DTL5_9BACL|nr:chromate transporter [Paenibacillus tritici]NQX48024.1 chromate transporter [Paenibacillus tritici]